MINVRTYGKQPYQVVVVHAGPGYVGAAAGLARELSKRYGVIEPLQTQDTILGLVEELKEQIESITKEPVILIGHGWGAQLSAIFSAIHPDMVKKLVLISCLPLRISYIEEIDIRREYHYSQEDLKSYTAVKKSLKNKESSDKTEAFIELSRLCKISDEYQPFIVEQDTKDIVNVNGDLFYSIMHELGELVLSGKLIQYFTNIKCPICVIHGQYDSHPVEGIIEPLLELNIPHRLCIIDDSGHTPWRETLGIDDFLRALIYEIEESK
ncbi:MAG: alpha/beta hydrolase [Clostridiales bacterium]|nr:alpha/beta hydrolase [Clostridiales bacterium]